MRFVAALAFAALSICSGVLPGHAEKRVALVIGNAAYRNMPVLMNPKNDAADVGASLRGLGFETIVATDLDRSGMSDALDRFSRIADGADIAMVYYSGHGMQFAGTNYLLPIEARLDSAADVNKFRLMPLDDVLDTMRSVRGARVVVLDACRNNPVEEDLKRRLAAASGTKGEAALTRGLVRLSAGNGLLVAYATQANDVAIDGAGRNSPFTSAFLKHVATPEIDLRQMMFRVQDDVDRMTDHKQRPEVSSSIIGEFKLKVAALSSPAALPGDGAQAWGAVKDTTSQAVLEDFIRRYDDSIYGTLARARLEQLKKPQIALVAPPVQPVSPCGGSAPVLTVLSSRSAQPLSGAEECVLKPKDVFKECDRCPEMVVVPAGSFMMGSPASEPERNTDEGPQHPVTIGKAFAVGKFAVTFEEWDACAADGGCNGYRPSDQGWGRGRQPVVIMSWNNAKAYAAWLSRKTGKSYRLLSEAEREYVTRAGTTTPFWWGSSITPRQANYNGTSAYDGGAKGEYRKKTLPVDSFEPNPWGLYQVHGNVWDLVEDCYHDSYVGAPTDGSAWTSGDCSRRVLRGGAWYYGPALLRSADRAAAPPGDATFIFGFRLARTL